MENTLMRWRVKEMLDESKMQQKDLVATSGLTPSQVSNFVNHPEKITRADLHTLSRLCRGFGGVQVNRVLEFVPDP